MQKKTRKIILKGVKILLAILIIFMVFFVGKFQGFIWGVKAASNKYNHTLCEVLDRNETENGYCILTRNAKYNQAIVCPYGKFMIVGEKNMDEPLMFAMKIQSLVTGFIIGC